MHHGSPRRKVASLALVLTLTTLATLAVGPAMADADDSPRTGPWAEDGTVFLDTVRLSSDDPEADPVD